MKIETKYKLLLAGVAAASLVGCGGSSSSGGGVVSSGNLSANPAFTFEQTDYVGAVDPAATNNWWDFALDGSVPTSFAANSLEFNPLISTVPGDWSGITPAADCPSSKDAGSYTITDTATTYDLGGKTFKVCKLNGEIVVDETLTNDVVWQLSGKVEVGNGNRDLTSEDNVVSDATLTIEAGTVMRSENGAYLLITRGASIDAQGTATQPIVMWSNNDDDFDDRGQWGGLVLQGYAYNNKCGDPSANKYCNLTGEGQTGKFGGFDNADSSGTVKYVIVAEAGFEVIVDNELNGISFQGVGYGTTVDYIQVHQNDDDGIEFFGGAVDATHVVLTSNKDDDVDWDEGYVGNLQHGIIVKTTSSSNSRHAFELDTKGDAAESQWQESNPTVANFTAVSLLETAEEAGAGDGIHLKEGSEGQFVNVLIAGDFMNSVTITDDTNLTSYASVEDAFINVYVDGYQSSALNNGSSATVGTITQPGVGESFDSFNSHMAENDDVPAVPGTVIESKEID